MLKGLCKTFIHWNRLYFLIRGYKIPSAQLCLAYFIPDHPCAGLLLWIQLPSIMATSCDVTSVRVCHCCPSCHLIGWASLVSPLTSVTWACVRLWCASFLADLLTSVNIGEAGGALLGRLVKVWYIFRESFWAVNWQRYKQMCEIQVWSTCFITFYNDISTIQSELMEHYQSNTLKESNYTFT